VTSTPAGINCGRAGGSDCTESYSAGTMVALTGLPATENTFVGFTGGGCVSSGSNACVVTITADATVTATFAADRFTLGLTVVKAGTGSGTVTSTPAGIDCGAACTATFSAIGGGAVLLSATPAPSSTFAGWSGASSCAGSTGTCSVPIFGFSPATVTAIFNQ
jgi:hypothetical protein